MLRSVSLGAALLCIAAPARADEPWLVTLEGGYVQPLTEPQRTLFRPGLSGSAALYRPLIPWVAVGLRVRGATLFDGSSPEDPGRVDPGVGSLLTLSGAVRVRPFAAADDPRRGTGPWVEAAGGVGLTGDLGRGAIEIGLGWGFEAGAVDVGPALRYAQVIESRNTIDARDARLLLLSVEMTLFDRRFEPAARPAAPRERPPEPDPDRDGDGIVDAADECPEEPEDFDGFEDEDGCPDADNDGDGILDGADECPMQPEDFDGFEDEDGCPDPDNDGDGFPDDEDECPNQAEVVNGIDDEDGCPDEGLIELVDDRIVLDARVLFDLDRARIKPTADPVLEAIVALWRQHPEWTKLRIEGHADVRGPADLNKTISEVRARRTMQKLIELGIPTEIIDYEGYGASRPIDLRRTERAHQRNRRVEFVVVGRGREEAP